MEAVEKSYDEFWRLQVREAAGGRLRRLAEGHGHAERLFVQAVWLPAFQRTDDLYAEYEVRDFKDGTRFVDFAYIRSAFRICIEIDGFGPHWQHISREQFADQWVRQNDLVIDGWKIIRFAYDDLVKHPRRCQQTLQQLFGRWLGEYESAPRLGLREREVVRLALKVGGVVTPVQVAEHLGVSRKAALRLLKTMSSRSMMLPDSGTSRVRSYRCTGTDVWLY